MNPREAIYEYLEDKFELEGKIFSIEEDAEYEGMTITTTIWYSMLPDTFGVRDHLGHLEIDKSLSRILEIED